MNVQAMQLVPQWRFPIAENIRPEHGSKLVQASEPESGDLSGATIKPISGGSPIGARSISAHLYRPVRCDECGRELGNLRFGQEARKLHALHLERQAADAGVGQVGDVEAHAVDVEAARAVRVDFCRSLKKADGECDGCGGRQKEAVLVVPDVAPECDIVPVPCDEGDAIHLSDHAESPVGCVAVPTVAEGEGQCTLPGGLAHD